MSAFWQAARPWRRPRVLAMTGAVVLVAAAASAQFGGQWGRLPEGRNVPPRYPGVGFEDGAFTVCKIEYTEVRREPWGLGWATDYPYAGINLMTRLSELTKTPISRDINGNPNYWVVRLTDPELFHCPFIIGSDVGTMGLSPEEATALREYLLKGGFMWVDDFWGSQAWAQWSEQIHKALPEYQIVDIPREHAIRNMLFPVTEIPQVTNIQNWRQSGGNTQEQGSDSPYADFRMMADEKGRIMVVMTHNTDIGDSFEREGEDHEFFLQFSPRGYALGVDVLLYSLTH